MDRAWMYETRRTYPMFMKEASKFVDQAKAHALRENRRDIFYPCIDCKNEKMFQDPKIILGHIVERGFKDDYRTWTCHGEVAVRNHEADVFFFDAGQNFIIEDMSQGTIPEFGGSGIDDVDIDFDLENMLRHIEPEVVIATKQGLDNWKALEKATKDLLYDEPKGCDREYMVLRSVLELLRLKAKHGWSDTSFNDLLDLLRVMLPKPNLLPTNTYQAKKLICPLSLGVHKIHACVNHCILYRKEYADLDCCPTCGMSRYTMGNGSPHGEVGDQESSVPAKKKIPAMVKWYLPVEDRLKRLFSNRTDAELLRWHREGRKTDDMIRHPADARQWKNFDALHPEFAQEQ